MNSCPILSSVLEEIRDRNKKIIEQLDVLIVMSAETENIIKDTAEIKSNIKAILLACYTVS